MFMGIGTEPGKTNALRQGLSRNATLLLRRIAGNLDRKHEMQAGVRLLESKARSHSTRRERVQELVPQTPLLGAVAGDVAVVVARLKQTREGHLIHHAHRAGEEDH